MTQSPQRHTCGRCRWWRKYPAQTTPRFTSPVSIAVRWPTPVMWGCIDWELEIEQEAEDRKE